MILPNNNLAIEEGIANHCGLIHRPKQNDVDANDQHGNLFELKYTRKGSKTFSTPAVDVRPETIQKWKSLYWIGTIGQEVDQKFEVLEVKLIHPDKMQKFFESYENRLTIRQHISDIYKELGKDHPYLSLYQQEVEGFHKRGKACGNDPISLKYFKNGLTIDIHDSAKAKRQVANYVKKYPIEIQAASKDNALSLEFFDFN